MPDLLPLVANDLRSRVASVGVNPFLDPVIHTPWQSVVDAKSLHKTEKQLIQKLIESARTRPPRCVTFVAPPGWGKTHLLAWTRQHLDSMEDTYFAYVAPFLAGSSSEDGLQQHILRAALDGIWRRSPKRADRYKHKVRDHLVESYDNMVDRGPREIKHLLRTGTFWSRSFRRGKLKIFSRNPAEQNAALQQAFTRRGFLQAAFAEFERNHPLEFGLKPDWDTFVASCLLSCGNTSQRWHAERWFQGDKVPPEILEPFHLDEPLRGTQKILNTLFTLTRLGNILLCLGFDQFDTTFISLRRHNLSVGELLESPVTALCSISGFALVFTIQEANWNSLLTDLPSLTARMLEGNQGAKPQLQPLSDENALDLLRERMKAFIWSELPDVGIPKDQPDFPFTLDDIRQMRKDASSDHRGFLQLAAQKFSDLIHPDVKKKKIRVDTINPTQVLTHEATPIHISGVNFPAAVRVRFNGILSDSEPTCRPIEVEVTTPTAGLLGDVEVRVEDANDPENAGSIQLQFHDRQPVPSPYHQHIDGKKLSKRRKELDLTQDDVARKLIQTAAFSRYSVSYVTQRLSYAENNRPNAPDELYLELEKLYTRPLSSFRK